MSDNRCENCSNPLLQSKDFCDFCGYPQGGTRAEKISYNSKLIHLKDLVEESDKSVKGILSFAIIFFSMASVVCIFSLIFREGHFLNALFFCGVGFTYFLLNRLGKKSSYLMVILALLFYLLHTIFEFSYGLFLKSPVNLDGSFLESRGASLFFAMIPLAYLIFRLALMIVLAKYFITQLKLKRNEKMVNFVRLSMK